MYLAPDYVQGNQQMIIAAAWGIFLLGIVHCVIGFARFRKPISEAVFEGLFGKFQGLDHRRLAFWFLIFGPLLIMGGHVAIVAVEQANYGLLKILGGYLLATSMLGVIALPKSPFWATLILAPALIAGGYRWIA
jgi:hypothetical protein